MKDNDIKKMMDESVSKYEIKTTSNDILNAYYFSNEAKEEPKKKSHFTFLKFALPTLAMSLAVAAIVMIPPHFASDDKFPETNNTKQNQTAFSLFSGMSILNGLEGGQDSTPIALKRMKKLASTIEDDEDDELDDLDEEKNDENIPSMSFENMMITFDPSVEVINSLLETSINVESRITKGEFQGKYATYPYKLEVFNYTLYTNITLDEDDEDEDERETTYLGEVFTDETVSYKVELNIEEEPSDHEKEIEMKIIYDETSYLKIEQEIELDERSYKYTMYENGNKTYRQKISFEDDKEKNDSIDVEILDNGKTYIYENIISLESGLKGDYYLEENEDNKNTFEMVEEETKRIYTNNLNEKVEINL